MVDLKDIQAAAKVIAGHVCVTPFLHSRTLSDITGAQIHLKFENHQFTASFKERGALNKLMSLDPAQAKKGVTHTCPAITFAAAWMSFRSTI